MTFNEEIANAKLANWGKTSVTYHITNKMISVKEEIEAQMKADKIKLALEKLKEAKVKKVSPEICAEFSHMYLSLAVGAFLSLKATTETHLRICSERAHL